MLPFKGLVIGGVFLEELRQEESSLIIGSILSRDGEVIKIPSSETAKKHKMKPR